MSGLLRTGRIWVGLATISCVVAWSDTVYAGGNGSSGGSSGGSHGRWSGGLRHRLFGGGSNGGYYSRGGSGGSSGGYRSVGSTNGSVPAVETQSTSAAQQSSVLLTVLVPADAKLYIEDQPTQLTGTRRQFVSPKLEAGREYIYSLRADVEKGDRVLSGKEELVVKAGDQATVEFEPSPENTELLASARR